MSTLETVPLDPMGSWPKSVHLLSEREDWALKAAVAARRPLLVRGEPGCGKSQLARVAAVKYKRAFISEVVHAGAECRDLQYHFDAVARLAEAQLLGQTQKVEQLRKLLNPINFLAPGPLWWALNWEDARTRARACSLGAYEPEAPTGWDPKQGCVLLIDEIDKAETDLPNGLLETLGNGAFSPPYLPTSVTTPEGTQAPIVIITTNEDRELPAAFVRRCLVLHMTLPKNADDLLEWLEVRGKAHFGDRVKAEIRQKAAQQLIEDRQTAISASQPPPGLAEYLDLLRALATLAKSKEEQIDALNHIQQFAYVKHREQPD